MVKAEVNREQAADVNDAVSNMNGEDGNAFSDLEMNNEYRNDLPNERGFFDDDLELMSMGGGLGMDRDAQDFIPEQALQLPFDQVNDVDMQEHLSGYDDEPEHHYNYEDNFDPEQELIRLEAIREQQRIEESKKQEDEQLLKIEEIEARDERSAESAESVLEDSANRRVLNTIFDETELSYADKQDYLTELEQKILGFEMAYIKTDDDAKDRHLKPQISETNFEAGGKTAG